MSIHVSNCKTMCRALSLSAHEAYLFHLYVNMCKNMCRTSSLSARVIFHLCIELFLPQQTNSRGNRGSRYLEAEVVSTGAAHLENTPTILIFVPTVVLCHTKLLYVVAESEMKQRKLKTLGDQLLIRRNRVNATTTTPVFYQTSPTLLLTA